MLQKRPQPVNDSAVDEILFRVRCVRDLLADADAQLRATRPDVYEARLVISTARGHVAAILGQHECAQPDSTDRAQEHAQAAKHLGREVAR